MASEVGGLDEAPKQSVLLDPNSRLAKILEAPEVVGAMDPGITHEAPRRKVPKRE
jgi:hypothetical protein